MSRLKIAIVHDWEPSLDELHWKDGLASAVRLLSERHDVHFITGGVLAAHLPHPYFPIFMVPTRQIPDVVKSLEPDAILMWGDLTRPNIEPLAQLGIPMALCFAGGEVNNPNWIYFDHIFVENEVYKRRFLDEVRVECSVSVAFGCNEELFDPEAVEVKNQDKVFDIFFPAVYADWKRHSLLTQAVEGQGWRGVTCGYMYTDREQWCWGDPQRVGFLTLPYTEAKGVRQLYAASKLCVIPSRADGGSQRTVLESLSMNCPVIVMSDSDKTTEYIKGENAGIICEPDPQRLRQAIHTALSTPGKTDTRSLILAKWTAKHYADALEKGLYEITSS